MSSGTWRVDGTDYKIGRFNFVFRMTKNRGWVKSTRTVDELNEESYHEAYKIFSHTRTEANKVIALAEIDNLILFYESNDVLSYQHFKRKRKCIEGMVCEAAFKKRSL